MLGSGAALFFHLPALHSVPQDFSELVAKMPKVKVPGRSNSHPEMHGDQLAQVATVAFLYNETDANCPKVKEFVQKEIPFKKIDRNESEKNEDSEKGLEWPLAVQNE